MFLWLPPLIGEARTPSPKRARLYFISPQNGESVTNPITVRFGLKGMGVAPAGIVKERTGHHHLLIDVQQRPPFHQVIPNDDRHLHFGGGETETTLSLPHGKHTLQLLLGDHSHIPHKPALISKKIKIHVKKK